MTERPTKKVSVCYRSKYNVTCKSQIRLIILQSIPYQNSSFIDIPGDKLLNPPGVKPISDNDINTSILEIGPVDRSFNLSVFEYGVLTCLSVFDYVYEDPSKCCIELMDGWITSDRGITPKTWHTLVPILKEITE